MQFPRYVTKQCLLYDHQQGFNWFYARPVFDLKTATPTSNKSYIHFTLTDTLIIQIVDQSQTLIVLYF
jgi:hypothetical protein